jgi:hypothetical protein
MKRAATFLIATAVCATSAKAQIYDDFRMQELQNNQWRMERQMREREEEIQRRQEQFDRRLREQEFYMRELEVAPAWQYRPLRP